MYVDGHEAIHPDILGRYAMDPNNHRRTQQEIIYALAQEIKEDQRANMRHEGVKCPRFHNPLESNTLQAIFHGSLKEVISSEIEPVNYGIREEEWGEEGYPSFEIITAGRRRKGEMRISLPDHIWRPRALLWCQALCVFSYISGEIDVS